MITTKFWLGGGRFSAVFFRRGENILELDPCFFGKRKLSEYYCFMATFRGTVTGQIRIWNERKRGVDAREFDSHTFTHAHGTVIPSWSICRVHVCIICKICVTLSVMVSETWTAFVQIVHIASTTSTPLAFEPSYMSPDIPLGLALG